MGQGLRASLCGRATCRILARALCRHKVAAEAGDADAAAVQR